MVAAVPAPLARNVKRHAGRAIAARWVLSMKHLLVVAVGAESIADEP
jgi:hypothetical protein